MKILMLIDTIGRRGGAERQFAGLAIFLKKSGYDVNVACYYPDDGYKESMVDSGIEVHMLKPSSNPLDKLLKVRALIKKLKPATVITFKGGPCLIGCLLKMTNPSWKLIVSERNTNQGTNIWTFVRFNLYRMADAIVPNSHSQNRYIDKHYNFLSHKVTTITNFTDTKLFKPNSEIAKTDHASIIVIARIHPQKNIIGFMQAVAKAKQKYSEIFKISWFGYKTDYSYYQECLKKRNDLGLDDVIDFKDPISTLSDEYPKYFLACLPSFYEGFPNAVCESMACGLPVIISNVCDNANIVEDKINGLLFDPLSIDNMTDALLQALSWDSPKRKKLGEASRKIALAKFSSEAFVSKYSALIEQLSCQE